MTFGEKLKELRLAKAWTQKELEDRSGVTQSALAKLEIGKQVPQLNTVHALCKALGVRCTVFDGCDFGEAEDKPGRGQPKKK